MADHRMWLEGSFATTAYAATRRRSTASADAAVAARVAKAHVGKWSSAILHDCVQIHGGIGMTWDYDLHLYFRRAISNEVLYGAPSEHYRSLVDLAEAGGVMADDHPELEEFRRSVREWLAEHVPAEGTRRAASCNGTTRAWPATGPSSARCGRAASPGSPCPSNTAGLGLSQAHQQAFREEAADYRMPEVFGNAFNVVLPTLLAHGSEELKQEFIPHILNGDHIWCQFLSEPSGGSDLAGLLTRAERDGDTWRINGAKIWTTGGNYSDYAICLARTEPRRPQARRARPCSSCRWPPPGITVVPLQAGRRDGGLLPGVPRRRGDPGGQRHRRGRRRLAGRHDAHGERAHRRRAGLVARRAPRRERGHGHRARRRPPRAGPARTGRDG